MMRRGEEEEEMKHTRMYYIYICIRKLMNYSIYLYQIEKCTKL